MMSTFQRRLLHTVALPAAMVNSIRQLLLGARWNAVMQAHDSCASAQQHLTAHTQSHLDLPSFILLDARPHTKHAQSFIQWLRGNPSTKWLPIVLIGAPATIREWAVSGTGHVNGSVLLNEDSEKDSITLANVCEFWINTNLTAPSRMRRDSRQAGDVRLDIQLTSDTSESIRRIFPSL
jgi:hypothetical protein